MRRFHCDNLERGRRTFVEQITAVTTLSSRRTPRLAGEQRQIGLDLGGEAGARLARRQGMGTSPDTLLRLVRRNSGREAPTPRILGVDDWAYRKGREYGTILVDLETHQVVDLLLELLGALAICLYNTSMKTPGIVRDTNAVVAAHALRQPAPRRRRPARRRALGRGHRRPSSSPGRTGIRPGPTDSIDAIGALVLIRET